MKLTLGQFIIRESLDPIVLPLFDQLVKEHGILAYNYFDATKAISLIPDNKLFEIVENWKKKK